MENGWKQGGRRRGGCNRGEPQPPMKGRFHAVWQAEWTERGNTLNLWACECVLPCCVSVCNPECVGVTGSVGLRHWKVSNVFVWSRGGISSRTMQGSNPCFSIPSSFSFHPPFPAPRRGPFSFCGCFCIHNCERKLNHNERETDLDGRRLSESMGTFVNEKITRCLAIMDLTVQGNHWSSTAVDDLWPSPVVFVVCLAPLALVNPRQCPLKHSSMTNQQQRKKRDSLFSLLNPQFHPLTVVSSSFFGLHKRHQAKSKQKLQRASCNAFRVCTVGWRQFS